MDGWMDGGRTFLIVARQEVEDLAKMPQTLPGTLLFFELMAAAASALE